MMKYIIKCVAVLVALSMLAASAQAAQGEDISSLTAQTAAGLSALGAKSGTLLAQGEEFPAGTSVCDWTAMALALTGREEDYDAYRESLQAYVEKAYAEEGGLDRVKSTTYHRIALTVMALGGDPAAFGTKPDGTAIDLIADGTYAFGGDSLGLQGLNGWIYALLALDASGAEVPQNAKFTRQDMIDAIVSAQEADGGFGLMPGRSDVDITAMALQALAPYAKEHAQVVEGGLAWLAASMNDSCRYSAYGSESAESSAQVILTLCALGIDPEEDARFTRENGDLLTGLAAFRQPDGTYAHTPEDGTGNHLATAQTLLALKALENLRMGKLWIFDFTDYAGPNRKTQSGTIYIIGIGAAAAAACALVAGKRKKYGKNN